MNKKPTMRHYLLLLSLFSYSICFSQKPVELEEVQITEIYAGDNKFSAEKNGDEFDFVFAGDVEVKTKKGKSLSISALQVGMQADIKYILSDTSFLVKRITLADNDQRIGGIRFTGFFDYYSDTTAFIGGKRVVLSPGVYIEGDDNKSCNCKGYIFKSFSQKPLSFGFNMSVKGVLRADGTLLAESVVACKTIMTESITKAIAAVSDKFEGGKLVYRRASGTYEGSISAGGIEYKLYASEDLQEYVTGVANKVLPAHLHDSEKEESEAFKYRFFVIDSEVPDAFSWPNGMVFINTGLLRSISNEAQLAFVLSRELAHINYYHTAKRTQKAGTTNKAINFFKKAITQVPSLIDRYKSKGDSAEKKNEIQNSLSRYADEADKILGDEKNKQILNSVLSVKDKVRPVELIGQYTKGQEAEADEVALSYMYISGYDIKEAGKFWTSLLEKMKKPGFAASISKSYKKIMPDGLLNSLEGDIKSSMLEKSSDLLLNKVFESVYNSPRLTQIRLSKVSEVIQNNYPANDMKPLKVNTKDFALVMKAMKPLR